MTSEKLEGKQPQTTEISPKAQITYLYPTVVENFRGVAEANIWVKNNSSQNGILGIRGYKGTEMVISNQWEARSGYEHKTRITISEQQVEEGKNTIEVKAGHFRNPEKGLIDFVTDEEQTIIVEVTKPKTMNEALKKERRMLEKKKEIEEHMKRAEERLKEKA